MYFNNLISPWSELDLLLSPLSCVCDAEKAYYDREEQQRLMQFLFGLNDVFEQARKKIMFMDPLPIVEKAYGMIVHIEDQLKLNEGNEDMK